MHPIEICIEILKMDKKTFAEKCGIDKFALFKILRRQEKPPENMIVFLEEKGFLGIRRNV